MLWTMDSGVLTCLLNMGKILTGVHTFTKLALMGKLGFTFFSFLYLLGGSFQALLYLQVDKISKENA